MKLPDLEDALVLVTGGAGFIGSHLSDELRRLGARVRVLDNLSTGSRDNLKDGPIEFLEGDIRDLDTCHQACQGARYVFHQAALGSVPRSVEEPATSIAVNTAGTANIFQAARDAKVTRVVYASSSSVYGDSAVLPKREGQEGRPLSPYALSKAMDEQLQDIFVRSYGMQIVGLRYFNIYGPRQSPEGPYAAVIPRFFAAGLKQQAPVIFGDGGQSRDFTYVGDAVRANLAAAGAEESPTGAYNIGAGGRTTIGELATRILAVVGCDLMPQLEPMRAGDVRHSCADISRAIRDLAFEPEVDLGRGLALTAQWWAERKPPSH